MGFPALATMIMNRTGLLGDFNPYQIDEASFSFHIDGIFGPMSPFPGFGFRLIFVNTQPAPAWTDVGRGLAMSSSSGNGRNLGRITTMII
jgi:hypothetical protein